MAIIELTPPTQGEIKRKGRVIELSGPGGAPIVAEAPGEPEVTDERAPEFTERLRGGGELAATLASAILAEPAAGVAGLVTSLIPGLEEGAGAGVVEGVKERLTIQPGEAGQQLGADILSGVVDLTPDFVKELGGEAIQLWKQAESFTLEKYGPLATTILATAPTAILEAIPGGIALKKMRGLRTTIADNIAEEGVDKLQEEGIDAIKAGPPPEAKDYAEITQDLRKKRIDEVAAEVRPDAEILASAEALGVDLNPSHYSTNRQFIDVENSLKSRPGSKLAAVEERAIKDTGQAADNLIEELRGATDKSVLDLDIKGDFDARLKSLNDKSDIAYKSVDDAIPTTTQVNPEASRAYINRALDDLGGDKTLLTTAEKNLLRIADEDSHLTYSAIDRIRKDIGSALGKKSGPFKDDDTGVLKQLYKVLSEDQQGVADAFGVGADYSAARKLVSTRKALEDEVISLFGREAGASIIPKMSQAATALTKGDTTKLTKLMDALPANRRQEVAATMLNDLFTQGARTQGQLGGGFVKAFEGLNRNRGAKAELFKHLPAGAEKRFDDIGRVTSGIFRSKALENKSKSARDIIAALEDGGIIGKVFGTAERAVTSIPVVGPVVEAVTDTITTATQKADDLLTSEAFKKSVEAAALGSLDQSQKITKTAVFKNWLAFQPDSVKTEIAAIGFIPFLTKPPEQETEQ
jgi:hypothetical protein